jgi:biopolymer transport protein ExbD
MKSKITIIAALLLAAPVLHAQAELRSSVSVHIAQDGAVRVKDKIISIAEFRALAAKALKQDKNATVRIVAASSASAKLVTSVLDACRAEGITRFSIDTSPEKKPNKAPEPTSGTVMPPAEPGVMPFPPVAHL